MTHLEKRRDELWQGLSRTLNWELFDYGKVAINDLLLGSLYRTALGTPLAGTEPDPLSLASSRQTLSDAFQKSLFLWTKTKDDLVREMDSELQMPGWGNVWTQPIINRVNMLATGVRTQIGVKGRLRPQRQIASRCNPGRAASQRRNRPAAKDADSRKR